MRARIYVEDNFFNAFNNYQAGGSIHDVDNTTVNKNQLINILKHSEFHSTITTKQFINIHNKLSQNYQTTDAKDFFLFRAMRSGKLFLSPVDNSKPYSLFLLDKGDADITSFNELNNLISAGINYNFESPLIPKSFASKLVNKDMIGIEVIKHRCRNIMVIDPYLFIDQARMEPKIPNVIKLLNELYFNNLNTHCHLSILINNPENNGMIISKIQAIKDGMNNPNLSVSVYAHKEGLLKNNRHLITDHSIIDCQHLFDRDDASISCSFFYDSEINENFKRANNLLEKIKKSFDNDPTQIGTITYKFGNILDNGLFEEL